MYNGGYNFTTDSVSSSNAADFFSNLGNIGAGLAVLFFFLALVVTAIAVFLIIAECKVFKKAGEDWWKAIIPVYGTWISAKIAGLAWWWCPILLGVSALSTIGDLSYITGFAALVIMFNFNYNISKKFGKTNGFAVLLTLLPIIGVPILAFGSAKYQATVKTDKNGIFAVENSLAK